MKYILKYNRPFSLFGVLCFTRSVSPLGMLKNRRSPAPLFVSAANCPPQKISGFLITDCAAPQSNHIFVKTQFSAKMLRNMLF